MVKLCEMCMHNGWLIPDEGILTCEGCENKSMFRPVYTGTTKGVEHDDGKRTGTGKTGRIQGKRQVAG